MFCCYTLSINLPNHLSTFSKSQFFFSDLGSYPAEPRVIPGSMHSGHPRQGFEGWYIGYQESKLGLCSRQAPRPIVLSVSGPILLQFFSLKDNRFYFLLKHRDLWTGELGREVAVHTSCIQLIHFGSITAL